MPSAQQSTLGMLWRDDASDIATAAALALAGVMPGAPAGLPAARLLPIAGILAAYARGASTLESAVSLAFDAPARVEEIARMLSGDTVSDAARQAARALLDG